jgi:hypothetical protein
MGKLKSQLPGQNSYQAEANGANQFPDSEFRAPGTPDLAAKIDRSEALNHT